MGLKGFEGVAGNEQRGYKIVGSGPAMFCPVRLFDRQLQSIDKGMSNG